MNEQQYTVILGLLADKVKEQETTINLQAWQIEDLQKKLAEAEYHLNPNGKRPKTLEIRDRRGIE